MVAPSNVAAYTFRSCFRPDPEEIVAVSLITGFTVMITVV